MSKLSMLMKLLLGILLLSHPATLLASKRKKQSPRTKNATYPYSAGIRAGNFLGGAVGIGLQGGMQLYRDWQAEILLISGDIALQKIESATVETQKLSAQASQYTIRLTREIYKNLRLGLGLGRRTINADIKVRDLIEKTELETKMHVVSDVITIQLNHTWTFRGKYSVGIDWLSLSIPYSHQTSVSNLSNADERGNENFVDLITASEDAAKKLGEATIFGLLVLQFTYNW